MMFITVGSTRMQIRQDGDRWAVWYVWNDHCSEWLSTFSHLESAILYALTFFKPATA